MTDPGPCNCEQSLKLKRELKQIKIKLFHIFTHLCHVKSESANVNLAKEHVFEMVSWKEREDLFNKERDTRGLLSVKDFKK